MLLGMRTSKKQPRKPAAKPKAKPKSNTPLKSRNEIFAYEYVINGGNASLAAKKAGSKAENLAVAGVEFLRKPDVVKNIASIRARLREELHVAAKEVIGSLLLTARATMADCVDEKGKFDWEKARLTGVVEQIKKLETEEDIGYDVKGKAIVLQHVKVELYSRLEANKQLAHMLGLQQSPKPNEYESVRNGVKAYMETNECTIQEAIDNLSAKFPVVARYTSQLLEEGVLPG